MQMALIADSPCRYRLGGMGQEMLVCPCVPGGSNRVRGTGGGGRGGRNGLAGQFARDITGSKIPIFLFDQDGGATGQPGVLLWKAQLQMAARLGFGILHWICSGTIQNARNGRLAAFSLSLPPSVASSPQLPPDWLLSHRF